MGIDAWSTIAASNNASPPDGAPEGMAAGTVNNTMRQIMASVRAWYEDAQWVNLGLTPTRIDGDTFSLTGDVTATFHAGRRLKVAGSATGYATISASSYSAPNTNIDVTMDSGSLPATLSTVYVSILSSTNSAVPTQANPTWTGAASGGSLSLSTPLPIASGGTGANTAAGVRSAIGVSATGSDTTYSFRANNLADLTSAVTARANLGLTIGSDIPSAGGSGANGTWNINISGNAATATTATTASNVVGPVSIAQGGTSATTAASARSNLGLVSVASTGSASDLTTGSIADARVPSSAVTQHQGSLSIATSQLTGTLADARVAQSNVTQHQAALAIGASQVTSGTFADARIASSSVTQYQSSLQIAGTQITSGTINAARLPTQFLALDLTSKFTLSGTITPTALGTTTNDWNPGSLTNVSVIRMSASSPGVVITGITGMTSGQACLLINVGTNIITLNHEDTNSTAANRFAIGGSASTGLAANEMTWLWYDGTSSRIRVINT